VTVLVHKQSDSDCRFSRLATSGRRKTEAGLSAVAPGLRCDDVIERSEDERKVLNSRLWLPVGLQGL
jgi:hypothetical protein